MRASRGKAAPDLDLLRLHAQYGDYRVSVEIDTGVVEGRFPRRALSALLEWYAEHRIELSEDWALAAAHQPLKKIAPLE